MGKIVKYCAACEESFAEKFVFCPNCAAPMTAFEMSPVMKETAPVEEFESPVVEDFAPPPTMDEPIFRTSEPVSARVAPPVEAAPVVEKPVVENFSAPQTQSFSNDSATKEFSLEDVLEEDVLIEKTPVVETPVQATIVETASANIEGAPVEDAPAETKTYAAAAASANGNGNFHQPTKNDNFQTSKLNQSSDDDVFRVTVIEEKNGKQRNGLLLGSMVVVLTLALGGTVYSLFTKDAGVGAIGDESLFAAIVVEDVPMEIEEQPKPKDKDAGGGGGGGGKEEPEPASKGRLVSQSENPITPPSAKVPQLTNPSIPIIQETKGNIKRPITEERAGLPGSDNLNPSNGRGSGGGIGSGTGTGIGGGNGTGEGNGNGSGSGNGDGNGNGDGRGDGTSTLR